VVAVAVVLATTLLQVNLVVLVVALLKILVQLVVQIIQHVLVVLVVPTLEVGVVDQDKLLLLDLLVLVEQVVLEL
jgi:hypothetical protein